MPIPGTIVINAGDLFHSWSNGKILATTHRVTIPENAKRLGIPRQSIAFFSHPNYNTNIEYTNEKGHNVSRNAYKYLKQRFDETIIGHSSQKAMSSTMWWNERNLWLYFQMEWISTEILSYRILRILFFLVNLIYFKYLWFFL